MADTQAYSVDWTVVIEPEGDVSDDVAEITVIEEEGVDSATVVLDTSKNPHALEEDRDIHITITDGNDTEEFDGFVDAVKDDETRPLVTIDARTAPGLLDDTNAVGVIEASDIWGVIDGVMDSSAGKVRQITFDPSAHRNQYGTFGNQVNFGQVTVSSINIAGLGDSYYKEELEVRETADQDQEAEIRFDYYTNTTTNTYSLTITGRDSDFNTVEAQIDLPPGSDAQEAFGEEIVRLPLEGGNQMWEQVESITTNVPDPAPAGEIINLKGNLWNFVKTNWRYRVDDLTTTRQAISSLVSYMTGIDPDNDWEYIVDESQNELFIRPETNTDPDRYRFREGDNVIKPVAKRDLDGVRNMVKVTGAFGVKFWAWAYNGDFRYSFSNPFESGAFPSGGTKFADSPGDGRNDIDQRNIRADSLSSNEITSSFQAWDIGKQGLRDLYRTPVTGQAPTEGILDADVGDEAEVFFPSRGIPQKVASNIYNIDKVEYRITPTEAKTKIDFGTKRANLADHIAAGGNMVRNDVSNTTARYSESITKSNQITEEQERQDRFPIVGELIEQNRDGTWQVETEDGETFDSVRVI